MLTLKIPDQELFNDETQEFVTVKGQVVKFEHSLVSLSKWEEKYKKPFLTKEDKSRRETLDYFRFMTITQNVPDALYITMPNEIYTQLIAYIEDPMSATTFTKVEERRKVNREVITSEIIYYWMIALQIPLECQKWHLNRLLTLINVCNIKNQPKRRMSRAEVLAQNRVLNEQRRQQLNTTG